MAATSAAPAPGSIAYFDQVAPSYAPPGREAQLAQATLALAPPIGPGSVVLDNAAGPGVVAGEIVRQTAAAAAAAGRGPAPAIYAADLSAGMIAELQKRWPSVHAAVMDAQALTYADSTFTHVFMSLGIFLLPDPARGAAEIYRTLQPGGVAVVSAIHQVGWVRVFQAAQQRVRPGSAPWPGVADGSWTTGGRLQRVLEEAGFAAGHIRMATLDLRQPGSTMVPFVESVKAGVAKAITAGWSEAETRQFDDAVQDSIAKLGSDPAEMEVILWAAVAQK